MPSDSSAERLALLYRLSQSFNACCLDLDKLLNQVIDEVMTITDAERGFVMLQWVDKGPDMRVTRGMQHGSVPGTLPEVSHHVLDKVLHEKQPIASCCTQEEAGSGVPQLTTELGALSILGVPLLVRGEVSGIIYVDKQEGNGRFTQADLDLLTSIAATAAIAVENARLYQVAIENARLERELQMAYDIQTALLPGKTPDIPGWQFAAQWQPAREVAGDYYDFIRVDGGQLGLVIADVSDKGMPAALFMANTRSIVRTNMDCMFSPAEILAHANRLICADATKGMFVSLFYALLDLETGELTYANAGHNPPLLSHTDQQELEELERTGMVLGVEADAAYEQRTVHLNPNDFVLLYTDGVTDATNAHLQDLGVERLQHVISRRRHASAVDIVSALDLAITDFVGHVAQFDDIAVVVAKRMR